jgi:transposase
LSQGGYSTWEVRVRAVSALERGHAVCQVADAYGVNRTTLFRWMQRYTCEGRRGLERRGGSGRPRVLKALDLEAVNNLVLEPASAFGFETDLWTVGRLRRVIREQYGVRVSPDTVWRRLREAGFTYQKPERRLGNGVSTIYTYNVGDFTIYPGITVMSP